MSGFRETSLAAKSAASSRSWPSRGPSSDASSGGGGASSTRRLYERSQSLPPGGGAGPYALRVLMRLHRPRAGSFSPPNISETAAKESRLYVYLPSDMSSKAGSSMAIWTRRFAECTDSFSKPPAPSMPWRIWCIMVSSSNLESRTQNSRSPPDTVFENLSSSSGKKCCG